jgi:mRNA interferase MazF
MALPSVRRGEIWAVDFEPQTHKEESGKRGRPALVLQTDLLNVAGHPTTIVVPGTSKIYRDAVGDAWPLRVSIGKPPGLDAETDLLIDQIRTIANHRLRGMGPVATLDDATMKRVVEALRLLTG